MDFTYEIHFILEESIIYWINIISHANRLEVETYIDQWQSQQLITPLELHKN